MVSVISETVPAGTSFQAFVGALQIRHHLATPSTARAWGRLMSATVSRGPHGPVAEVQEQAFLVGCDISFDEDGFTALGTVTWRDGLMAGEIKEAISAGVTIQIQPMPQEAEEQNVEVNHLQPEPTGGGWSEAIAASEIPNPPGDASETQEPSPSGWGAAVASSVSPQISNRSLGLDEALKKIRRGDLVVHPKFGDCTVVKSVQGGKIKIRRNVGGFLDLQLRVFKIRQEADRGDRRVFVLEINRG